MMSSAEGERLIGFEAAMQELAGLRLAAARYRSLEPAAAALLGELHDLGRSLRQANRRGLFTDDVVEASADRVRRLRAEWQGHLAVLRDSPLYRDALEAYSREDQKRLAVLLPALFTDLELDSSPPQLFQPITLTTHRRAGGSPFRAAADIASELDRTRREGLRPSPQRGDWWDTDLPSLSFTHELGAVDGAAALALESVPPPYAVFRDGEASLIFSARLLLDFSVILAESSDDTWFEAAEGSYAEYRDALARELRQRALPLRIVPAWG